MKSHWLGGRRSVANGAKDWSVTRIVADSVKEIVVSWSIAIDRREANWWRWGANRCELKCRDGPARSKLTTVRHEPLWAEASRQTDDGEAWTIASWSVATNWREVNQRQWGANRCELKHRDGPVWSESVIVTRKPLQAEASRQTGKKWIGDGMAMLFVSATVRSIHLELCVSTTLWNFLWEMTGFGTFCERVRKWNNKTKRAEYNF